MIAYSFGENSYYNTQFWLLNQCDDKNFCWEFVEIFLYFSWPEKNTDFVCRASSSMTCYSMHLSAPRRPFERVSSFLENYKHAHAQNSIHDFNNLYYSVEGKSVLWIYPVTNCSLSMMNSKHSSSRKRLHLKLSIRNFISLSMIRYDDIFDHFAVSLAIWIMLSLILRFIEFLQRYEIVNGLVEVDGVSIKDVEVEDDCGELSNLLATIPFLFKIKIQ